MKCKQIKKSIINFTLFYLILFVDKYYGKPKCKYSIRSVDAEKFRHEVVEKILSKIDKNTITVKEDLIHVV